MANVFDISVFGDKALQRKLNRLPEETQRKAIAPAFKRSLTRINAGIAAAFSGGIVQERTGQTVEALLKIKPRKLSRFGGADVVAWGITLPSRHHKTEEGRQTRAAGVTKHMRDVIYWLEYGTRHMAARAPYRTTVDDMQEREYDAVGRDIGRKIEQLARRL